MSSPTKAEKQYWDRLVNEIGCIICLKFRCIYNNQVSLHHISGRTKPGAHVNVLPLCGKHHQTGGEGVAIHPFKRKWESLYGKQIDLKKICDEMLENNQN